MKRLYLLLPLITLSLLLSACGLLLEFEELHQRDPYDYYLFAPPNYDGTEYWPAFIGIHGQGGSGRDCLRTWMEYAEEYQFILICPNMPSTPDGWVQSESEDYLVGILAEVSQEYLIQSKSFLAGFSAGAQFALGYTMRYPAFVSGASIISTGNYTSVTNPAARGVPFLITVGDQDTNRTSAAAELNSLLIRGGFDSTYYLIKDAGHEISPSAVNLTLQLFQRANP
jgi:poly(3-hydroxybutyrate) depolymerase